MMKWLIFPFDFFNVSLVLKTTFTEKGYSTRRRRCPGLCRLLVSNTDRLAAQVFQRLHDDSIQTPHSNYGSRLGLHEFLCQPNSICLLV